MEWQAVVPVGKAKFTFHFAGGMLTAYGVTPAVYETDNELFQQVIEHSDYFKTGKIVALASYEEDGDGEAGGEAKPSYASLGLSTPLGDGAGAASGAALGDGAGASGDGGLERIKMPTVKDARQFLIDGYGADASKLLKRDDVMRYGRAKGILFVIEK